MSGVCNDFFENDALLVLDKNKTITACSRQFVRLLGLKQKPLGVFFDELFVSESHLWNETAGWLPFSCTLAKNGKTAAGMMQCEKGGYRIVFSREPDAFEESCGGGGRCGHLSALVSQMQEGLAVHRLIFHEGRAVDYVVEDYNNSFAQLLGLHHKDEAGQRASEIFGKPPFLKKIIKALEIGKPAQFDAFYAGMGRHYLISVTPFSEDRFGTVVSDLSQSRHSQLLYKALNEAAAVVSGAVETKALFATVAQVLGKYGFECMLMPLCESQALPEMYLSFGQPQTVAGLPELTDTPYEEALRERRAVFIGSLDMPKALLESGLSPDLKCIAAPLIVDGALAGLLIIMSCGIKPNDMEAVTAFANQLAAMMEKTALINSLRIHIKKLEASKKELNDVAERLKMASRASRVGIWDMDLVRHVEYMDSALERIYGLEPGTFDGSLDTWRSFVHPDDQNRVAEAFMEALHSGGDYRVEYRIVLRNGQLRYISSMGVLHRDETGKPLRMVGTDWDITERKQAELALTAEKELLQTTLKSIGDGVMVTDNAGRITLANAQFARICGCTLEGMHGRLFEDVADAVYWRDGRRCDLPHRTLQTGRSITRTDCELVRADGKTVPVAYVVTPICDNEGAICGAVLVIRDITEEKKKQKRIDYLVYHDALTGVYNRRYFDQMQKKLDTPENLPLSVLSCDVNGLKLANDAFGHIVGDKLLRRMAAILVKACRDDDIVARTGGDEFMVLMPRADEAQAAQVCDMIKTLAGKTRTLTIDASISVGHDTKKQADESLRAVINCAERRMYRSKTREGAKIRGNTIRAIMMVLYQKSPFERAHARKVSRICCEIARRMGLGEREIGDLKEMAVMHDIGKVAIDEAILNKAGKLTQEEWAHIKSHPEVGYRILMASSEMAHIAASVLAHHERCDGTGYPNSVPCKDIPLMARIVAVADAYEAMTSDRPYRKAFAQGTALKEIADNKGTQFDSAVADTFLRMMNFY